MASKMDGQKGQGTLTRTQSSLLRSSPTLRSSIQSLSLVSEEEVISAQQDSDDEKQKKKKKKPLGSSSSPRTGNPFANPLLAFAMMICFTVFSLFFFSFFLYMKRAEIPTSEHLLLVLVFIAVALFFISKNKVLINHALVVIKQAWEENTKHFGISKSNAKPVQWFIGDSNADGASQKQKKIIREGVEFYSNGDFYEGEFHKGRCNGSGVYNYFINGRYEGDWIDGRYDGYGIESWARGSRYRGQYRQGLRHGFGAYRFYTGDSYAGEWSNGQSHGLGVQICADGSSFIGEFKSGGKHGLGCYYFRNGDRYAGEYFGDKIHGFGVYQFANGHCYEGSWHEGRRQGYGTYTFRNGETKCGEWDGGSLNHPLPPLNDAVIRAIQAARKTAQNAINLRRVDDQVNKAIAAANRAATAGRVAAIKAVQNRMDGKFCETDLELD